MRSSVVTGSLLASVAVLLVLPAIAPRAIPRLTRSADAGPSTPMPRATPPPFPDALRVPAELARSGRWEEALVALSTADAADPRGRALRDVLTAEALVRVGELEQAAEVAQRLLDDASGERARAAAPWLPRAAFIAASARAAAGDAAGATQALALAGEGLPALAEDALRLRVALLTDTDPAAAVALVEPRADAADASASWLALAAGASRAAGDAERELRWLRHLHFEHPATTEGRAASASPLLAGATAAALREGRADLVLRRADLLLEADLEKLAAADVAALVKAGVPPAQRAELDLVAGRFHRATGQPARALPHLTKAAAAEGPLACRAAFHASRASRSLRRTADASRWMARAAEGCPCELRDRAALELAEAADAQGNQEQARRWWRRVAQDSVTPRQRERAAWRAAWSAWREGRHDEALADFEALVAAAPDSREAAAARYWTARHAQARGDEALANDMLRALAADFPRDWHGLLAAEATAVEIPPLPPCNEQERHDEAFRLALAASGDEATASMLVDLDDLGLVDAALAEASAVTVDASATSGFRCLVLARASREREALVEFRRAVPDWRRRVDVPAALTCAAWPIRHEDVLLPAARAAGLEPALVFGLVHQESVFDARAVSHAGARGLMQIMPATGQTIARWLGERVTTPKLLDPALNARYGTTYLSRLLQEQGRVEVALAGYNAGPGRSKRWWAATPDGDVATFVENIPFDETRDYVKAIAVNERLYRTRLAEASVAAGQ